MLEEKWGYIPNAAGYIWTQEKQNAATDGMVIKHGQKWIGKMVVDCSGAFTYWYGKAGSTMYHGSNTMWRQWTTSKGKIGAIELTPGMAVFKQCDDGGEPSQFRGDGQGNFYHIGLYIGNGKVIESKGTAYGVVESDIKQWTHAAKLKNTIYGGSERPEDPQESGGVFPRQGIVTLSSGTLNMRKSNDTSSVVLARLPNGLEVTLLGELAGWYKVKYNGMTGYISAQYIRDAGYTPVEETTYVVTCRGLSKQQVSEVESLLNNAGFNKTEWSEEGD